jgi:hypothetical protein
MPNLNEFLHSDIFRIVDSAQKLEMDDFLRLTSQFNDGDMDQVLLSNPRRKICKGFQDEPIDQIPREVEQDPYLL